MQTEIRVPDEPAIQYGPGFPKSDWSFPTMEEYETLPYQAQREHALMALFNGYNELHAEMCKVMDRTRQG